MARNTCYKFVYYDKESDGICCGKSGYGKYSLILDEQIILEGNAESQDFTISQTTKFCVGDDGTLVGTPQTTTTTTIVESPNLDVCCTLDCDVGTVCVQLRNQYGYNV